jgi:site-specific recombinase XerD
MRVKETSPQYRPNILICEVTGMSSIKLSQAIVEYLSYEKVEAGHSETTVACRQSILRYFLHWLGTQGLYDPDVGKITISNIRTYMVHLHDDRKVMPKTIRGYLEAIRGLYAYLVKYSYVADSPAHRITLPKPNAPHRELVSTDELVRMMQACDYLTPKYRALMAKAVMAMYVYAGLRTNELLALEVGDISMDGEDMFVAVRHGKGDKRRVVPMHKEAVPILHDYLAIRPEVSYGRLFVLDKLRWLGLCGLHSLFADIKWVAKIDKPKLTPHALRHNYASRLHANDVNLYDIQQLLGHADIQTTVRYLHGDMQQLKRVAQRAGLYEREENTPK